MGRSVCQFLLRVKLRLGWESWDSRGTASETMWILRSCLLLAEQLIPDAEWPGCSEVSTGQGGMFSGGSLTSDLIGAPSQIA